MDRTNTTIAKHISEIISDIADKPTEQAVSTCIEEGIHFTVAEFIRCRYGIINVALGGEEICGSNDTTKTITNKLKKIL